MESRSEATNLFFTTSDKPNASNEKKKNKILVGSRYLEAV